MTKNVPGIPGNIQDSGKSLRIPDSGKSLRLPEWGKSFREKKDNMDGFQETSPDYKALWEASLQKAKDVEEEESEGSEGDSSEGEDGSPFVLRESKAQVGYRNSNQMFNQAAILRASSTGCFRCRVCGLYLSADQHLRSQHHGDRTPAERARSVGFLVRLLQSEEGARLLSSMELAERRNGNGSSDLGDMCKRLQHRVDRANKHIGNAILNRLPQEQMEDHQPCGNLGA